MSRNRLWVIAAVAGMLVIAVGGWALGISPVLDQASAANAQVSTIDANNAAGLTRLASLKSQFADLATQQTALDGLRASIPEDAGAAAFLSELNALSAAHGVTLTSVTIASATVYQAPVAATPPASSTGAASTATPTPTPTAATTPATTPTTPSTGGAFVLVPVTIQATGSFDNVRDFVGAIQGGTRLYFAASIAINADPTGGNAATGTLTGDIFTLQGTSSAAATSATATPATPAPTNTAKPTGTSTPTP